jgi:hypothetical protein
MPGYSWRNNKSGKVYDIIRKYSEYEQHPELSETDMEQAEYDLAEWERIIRGMPTVVKPWSWGPGKGSWIVAFLVSGITFLQRGNW